MSSEEFYWPQITEIIWNTLQKVWIMPGIQGGYSESGWVVPVITNATNTMGTTPHQLFNIASGR